jgi:diaminohydroxyphosphoribosylaminopyrimidine deaminase/5-amino-6-(5-phosphoribosylamino)uracil reductase
VIASATGAVLASGHTQATGGPHAEAVALREAAARGVALQGATAYVTLEPCSHFGRTPPCADALVAAGIARVVVALRDPNPLVGGQGLERLRAAGIRVDLLDEAHPLAVQAREINLGFLSRILRQRPWVRLKVAASLDGLTALPDGRSQWITGPEARADGHALRARAGAVLTGIGTALADDPQLTARGVDAPRQPLRVLLDSRLRLPDGARLLSVPQELRIYTADTTTPRAQALRERGVALVAAPAAAGRLDLAAVLADLAGEAQVNELHVEAGAEMNGALIAAGLVDEYLVYLAPKLLGQGRGMWQLLPPAGLDQAPTLGWSDVRTVGADLRLLLREPGRERF